ncbi:MAG: hypothetical protein ACRDCW_03815 [Sarcina sp.]
MDIDLNIKERIEQYYQAIQEIPEKSLKRIILVEKIINEVEVENNTLLNKIKGNELTISFLQEIKSWESLGKVYIVINIYWNI